MPDGRIAVLPSEWFSRFGDLFRFGQSVGDSIRLASHHFRVKELAQTGSLSEVDIEDGAFSVVEIPNGLKALLRPYQLYGFRWLVNLQKNGNKNRRYPAVTYSNAYLPCSQLLG